MKNKVLIGAVLVLSFLILSFVYLYSRSNITVINSSLPDKVVAQKVSDEFTKGKEIKGEFVSSQNYLGQFLLRFYTYNRINTDEITFRIKDKAQDSWYYEHTYKTDQFLPDNLFTFGFPIIPDSKGKTYVFEIESVNGTPEESVTLSKIEPLAALSFQYPKKLLIKNPNVAIEFLQNKIKYLVIDREMIIQFLIYVNFILLILILEYILLKETFDSRFRIRVGGSTIIIAGLVLMLASAVILYLKKPELSLDLTITSYFLLILGVIYQALRND